MTPRQKAREWLAMPISDTLREASLARLILEEFHAGRMEGRMEAWNEMDDRVPYPPPEPSAN